MISPSAGSLIELLPRGDWPHRVGAPLIVRHAAGMTLVVFVIQRRAGAGRQCEVFEV